jgi:hypothetical protein
MKVGLSEHLTFKGNLNRTRYGWLRLTPAHSIHLVSELLDTHTNENAIVLDPFCGTGTTALVCAERGIRSDTTDINPFLLWLTCAKTRCYTPEDVAGFRRNASHVAGAMRAAKGSAAWIPSLYQIEKWWDDKTLCALSHAICKIRELAAVIPGPVSDLLKVAFCRTMIEQAQVSFGHQSMSFKREQKTSLFSDMDFVAETVASHWERVVDAIAPAACSPILAQPNTLLCDARRLSKMLEANRYACVITSPPYPNRMSYIRELRPYMYWLGYLQNGRDAGELDWQAIGGTWGCATSNVARWQPEHDREIPYDGFQDILTAIEKHSPVLSRYVHKYFDDMMLHVGELFRVVKSGGDISYVVGNSRFYDVLLPVETIFARLFEAAGFVQSNIRVIRKRTSKKELFEFVVSAHKP